MQVQVRVCNAAVCTTTPSILVKICEEDDEEREEAIDNSLENVRFCVACGLFCSV